MACLASATKNPDNSSLLPLPQVVVQPFLRFITGAQNGGNDAGVPSASGVITGWRNVMTLSLHNKLPADIHVRAHASSSVATSPAHHLDRMHRVDSVRRDTVCHAMHLECIGASLGGSCQERNPGVRTAMLGSWSDACTYKGSCST